MTDTVNSAGLNFFGAMTASISHEIKNRMAIINEQAGLLEDFVHMASRGREIDPERLTRLAEKVKMQISLADDIIKNMNRFAHSVDQIWYEADIREVLCLSARLSKRLADMHATTLSVADADSAGPALKTAPFVIMNLIWACLDGLMRDAAKGKTVTLGCRRTADGVDIWVSAAVEAQRFRELLAGDTLQGLARTLGAEADIDAQTPGIVFKLPAGGPR